MTYSYELRHEADAEFSETYIWYEEQQENLGDKFIDSFYDKFNQICRNPYHYKKSHGNYHEALTDKFPFLIVYEIDEEKRKVIVLAIFHTSRNPKKKFRRRKL